MIVISVLLAIVIMLSLVTINLIWHQNSEMKALFDNPIKEGGVPQDTPIKDEKESGHTNYGMASDADQSQEDNQDSCCAREEGGANGTPSITEESVVGHTIFGMASDTNQSQEDNQDSCCAREIEELHVRIVAIADGIGSALYAKEGSAFVAETAVELVSKALIVGAGTIDFQSVFSEIQDRLKEKIMFCHSSELPTLPDNSFGTTLIVGVDYPEKFVAAYVGNGVIYHLSGFFTEFPKSICIPWNSVNVLNPHTIPQNGRETLYKFFCYGAGPSQYSPTVIQINKEQRTPGDIFLIATDGIDSADQVTPVIDKRKNIYKPTSRVMDEFYDYLKQFLQGNEYISDETLRVMLQRFLLEMKESDMLDDDSTMGVFISQKAIDYFR